MWHHYFLELRQHSVNVELDGNRVVNGTELIPCNVHEVIYLVCILANGFILLLAQSAVSCPVKVLLYPSILGVAKVGLNGIFSVDFMGP